MTFVDTLSRRISSQQYFAFKQSLDGLEVFTENRDEISLLDGGDQRLLREFF